MQEHGVARLAARNAVRVLAAEWLVEVVQGRGAEIRRQQKYRSELELYYDA